MKLLQLLIICMVIIIAGASCAPADDITSSAAGEPQPTATTSSLSGLFADYDDCGELGAALEENEKETFAGCWLEHPGDSFVIAFTRDGETMIRNYVKEGSSLDNRIKLITLDTPLAELLSIQQQTMDMLVDLGLFCGGSTDVKENVVKVYVTDSVLFDRTLAEAGVRLPSHVITEIVYEPLREVPFEVNPPEGVHFPQLKMASSMYMLAALTGTLELKDGYLCVGDTVIIWQPDYFLHEHDGYIDVLDREGKVVGRVGEEIVMGGGGIGYENVDRMLKKPLPDNFSGNCFLQGSGTRMSLNFSSDLFSLDVIRNGDGKLYFLKARPRLNETMMEEKTFMGIYRATRAGTLLRNPFFYVELENNAVNMYTLFWPQDHTMRITNGIPEILDGNGNVVVRDGEQVTLTGGVMYGINTDITRQLFDEIPGGFSTSYFVVTTIDSPATNTITTSFEVDSLPVTFTAPTGLSLSGIRLETGTCEQDYHPLLDSPVTYEKGDACLVLTGTIHNASRDRFELAIWAEGFNNAGGKVAVTLDAAHIVGQIGLHAEYDETVTFIIHLNPSDDLAELRINARSYDQVPP